MNIEDLYIGCPVLFEYCECIVDGLGKDRVHLKGEPEDFWVSPNELEQIPSDTKLEEYLKNTNQ